MNNNSFQMALIGCGAMGSAMARGWLISPLKFDLTVVTPNHDSVMALPNSDKIKWFSSYSALPVGYEPDVIVFAARSDLISEILPLIPKSHVKSSVIVSVAAGKNLDYYYDYLPKSASVVKVMPNLPVTFHVGMSSGFKNESCKPEQKLLIQKLFKTLGKFIWLDDEEKFHAVTATSGCGPAYLYLLEEAMIKAGISQGLSEEQSEQLSRQTIVGSAKMLVYEYEKAVDLKKRVTSPNGVTAAARSVLERQGGMIDLFVEAFEKAVNRSRDIAKN